MEAVAFVMQAVAFVMEAVAFVMEAVAFAVEAVASEPKTGGFGPKCDILTRKELLGRAFRDEGWRGWRAGDSTAKQTSVASRNGPGDPFYLFRWEKDARNVVIEIEIEIEIGIGINSRGDLSPSTQETIDKRVGRTVPGEPPNGLGGRKFDFDRGGRPRRTAQASALRRFMH
ncbi:MAG: hypothetical protein GXX91_14335 [Verrucomicrobiaceae bacterium]|nr:hypothetical protein [Verrucomicrobiaceae bacterium]